MDVIEILKMGLPGLVFLLSLLSYRLLTKEQHKNKPSPPILKSIKQFMHVNILLAILTVAAPLTESILIPNNSSVFNVEAKMSGTRLETGTAAVCADAEYSGRYILMTDSTTFKMVQVRAVGLLPCTDKEVIALNQIEASKLGWNTNVIGMFVEVAAAAQGQRYILKEG